jgi:YD repeat-containing protein
LAACYHGSISPPAVSNGASASKATPVHGTANAPLTLRGLTEYTIPTNGNTQPLDIKRGPDGNLWFTEVGSGAIGRITPAGTIAQFAIPAPAFGITAAPDGNLWFTYHAFSNNVGRITTAGGVSQFPIAPLCNCTENSARVDGGIALGPDGELYFGAMQGSLLHGDLTYGIEKMTTTGTATVLYAGKSNSYPLAEPLWLTRGPDDAVWFTSRASIGYGRITPGGALTFYEHLCSNGGPFDITPGPDGALWFTDRCSGPDKIARVNTSGTITAEYTIPTANSYPAEIVSGQDANLWFTEQIAGGIGRITPSGAITEFALAAGRQPYGITRGPNGTIWFTEGGDNRIAKFRPAAQGPPR